MGQAPAPEFYKSKDPKASQVLVDPLIRPTEGGQIAIITWQVCYPIHYLCQKTMPDCRTEKYRNWYGITFIMSMFWISFYSYLMVSCRRIHIIIARNCTNFLYRVCALHFGCCRWLCIIRVW